MVRRTGDEAQEGNGSGSGGSFSSFSSLSMVAFLVSALGFVLNIMNLAFLTIDNSTSQHGYDFHDEIIESFLRMGGDWEKKEKIALRDEDDEDEEDDDVIDNYAASVTVPGGDDTSSADGRHEAAVFRSVLQRAVSSLETCDGLPVSDFQISDKMPNISDVPPLEEFGIINALTSWLASSPHAGGNFSQNSIENNKSQSYPTCYLPPSKSCHVNHCSIILMSHSTDRLAKLMGPLEKLASRKATSEIILVWNSERSVLEKDGKNAAALLKWHHNTSHPFRIFFSLDEGLGNNLLNRYHPKIEPKEEAIMYFDDDGPFFSELAMSDVGLELWKRNSDSQVGCFPRNIRFMSKRMKDAQNQATDASRAAVKAGLSFGFNAGSSEFSGTSTDSEIKKEIPMVSFTPTCRRQTSDIVEYNYHVFPQYAAHMLLPSGSILHRNYLCFIWHPALEELRKYVTTHPTHCDDQTISAIVSQLSGRAPRVFPRRVHPNKKPQGLGVEKNMTKKEKGSAGASVEATGKVDARHRRLLWQRKDWGPLREEAINSVLGFFGSVNPGSVGWCAGTEYDSKSRRGNSICDPEFPEYRLIPWVHRGGLGFDQCKTTRTAET